jgi:hypothetical protein
VPYTYNFDFVDTTVLYTLPQYIMGSFQVQFQDDNNDWNDVRVYSVEFDQNGSKALRLPFIRGSGRNGRLLWWGRNAAPPQDTITLLANITSVSTTLQFTSTENIDIAGVVKINDEWIQYAGRTIANGIVTLTNLVRGVYDTTAASHDADTIIYPGFVVHRQDLLQELEDFVFMQLYTLVLRNGSSQERQSFEAMLNFHMNMVNTFWRKYTSPRPINFHLHPEALGEPLDHKRMYPASGDRWRYS